MLKLQIDVSMCTCIYAYIMHPYAYIYLYLLRMIPYANMMRLIFQNISIYLEVKAYINIMRLISVWKYFKLLIRLSIQNLIFIIIILYILKIGARIRRTLVWIDELCSGSLIILIISRHSKNAYGNGTAYSLLAPTKRCGG